MTSFALILVLASAFIHATWNLLVKKSAGGPVFIWLFMTLSSMFLVPTVILLLLLGQQQVTWVGMIFVCGTTVLHLVYFLLLQRGYQTGDLSLVYPLARGLGPVLATGMAIVLLGERPSALALLGLVLVILGVILLGLRDGDDTIGRKPRVAVFYGVMTGVLISMYTVWDKYAVSELDVPPVVLEAFTGLGISLMLSPHAMRRWSAVQTVWQQKRAEVVGVAILAPLSYILILMAMSNTPLSYVAPMREISILIAAVLGTQFLGEGHTARRVVAAGSMVCGVIALAVG